MTTLIKRYGAQLFTYVNAYRLEAATSRLEDLAVAQTNDFREAQAAQRSSATPSLSKDTTPQFNTNVFSQDTHHSIAKEPIVEQKPPAILDYEKIINDLVDAWAAKSEKIGEVVREQVSSLGLLELMCV